MSGAVSATEGFAREEETAYVDYETAFANIRRASAPDVDGSGGGKHRASGSYCGDGDAHAARDRESFAACGEPVIWRPTPGQPWPPASGDRCAACDAAVLANQ